jgi:hypothetical protein
MSCTNPVPAAIVNPVLQARVVQGLQTLFTAELAWIENVYAIARIGVTKTEAGEFNYPQIYSGTGANYFDIRPDSSLDSYGFFEVNKAYDVDKDQDDVTYNLSFICWYNLPAMDGSKGYDYSPELIAHVLKVIRESDYNSNISNVSVDVNPENIFDKYSLDQATTQFLMYPYGAFKITFDYSDTVEVDCFDEFITATGGCEN